MPFKNYISNGNLALLVAALTFAATGYQGYISREHNRLSVQPRIEIIPQIGNNEKTGLYVYNLGLGPGIITKITTKSDGRLYDDFTDNLWPDVIKSLGSDEDCFAIGQLAPDVVVRPGDGDPLIAVSKFYREFLQKFDERASAQVSSARLAIENPISAAMIAKSLQDYINAETPILIKSLECYLHATQIINRNNLEITIHYKSMYGEEYKSTYKSKIDKKLTESENEYKINIQKFKEKINEIRSLPKQ